MNTEILNKDNEILELNKQIEEKEGVIVSLYDQMQEINNHYAQRIRDIDNYEQNLENNLNRVQDIMQKLNLSS